MRKPSIAAVALSLLAATALAQEAEVEVEEDQDAEQAPAAETPDVDPDQPRTMSGMSILGNEEAPKALVIIPWKSSEIGEDITLTNTLDERAQPVDRDVFLRELNFYEIRSGENPVEP